MIKKILFRYFTASKVIKLKKIKRKFDNSFKIFSKPVSLEIFQTTITNELGISRGDKIFVTASFGQLNAKFSPTDLITSLMDIVGEEGVIAMPYYPLIAEGESETEYIFDCKTSKANTGIVSNIFSRMDNVYMSIHPTKAICVWGRGAEEIVKDHNLSKTPYSNGSPYEKFLRLDNSKSIGLGVGNFPMGHCLEDIVSNSVGHYNNPISERLVRVNNEVIIYKTFIHNKKRNQIPPSKYVASVNTYKRCKMGYTFAYSVSNGDANRYYKEQFLLGNKSV